MAMKQLLIATTNQGKKREIREILADLQIEVLSLDDLPELKDIDVEETGKTFAENALLKAVEYGKLTQLMTLGDDTGLCVDALDGRPGIYSKRYGATDSERIIRLLDELKDVSLNQRTAHFLSVAALYDPITQLEHMEEGRVDGLIVERPIGSYGFGYDPVFYCSELGKTFGEATSDEKNNISHRGRALMKMKEFLSKLK